MLVVHGVLSLIFWGLAIVAFAFEVWALIDALGRPPRAFAVAGKQTKQIWLIILAVAALFGLAGAVRFISLLHILPIAAFIAAAVYLADVRPAVREIGRGGSSSGPYGSW